MKIEDAIQSKFVSVQQKAIVNLRFTSNFIGNLQNAYMSQFDLTMPQFNILRILRGANGELNVNTVKDRMIEKSPNTTRLMDKLIDKNLIIRTRCDKDKRVVFVKIAPLGLKLLDEIDSKLDLNSMVQVDISEKDAILLNELLDKIRSKYEH